MTVPTVDDLTIWQGDDQIESWQLFTVDEDGNEVLIDTDGWLARLTIREDKDAATELLCSTGNGRMQTGYDPPKWDNATAYTLGEQVVPTTLNGHVYTVTDAGTSHASTEPTWPTASGATVADNGVIWTEAGSDGDVTNLRLVLLAADTDPLTEWGHGVYALRVWVDGTIETTLSIGNATLSRDIARS